MADELLTVAQTCQLLGVSERTLRRVLKEPGIQAQLQAEYRQGRGKYRQVVLVPSDVLEGLKARFLDGERLSEQPKMNTGAIQANTGISVAGIAGIYEQRLADKDLLLVEKDKRIAELTARAEFAEQIVIRTQALLSMSVPDEKSISIWRKWFTRRKP